MNAPDQLAALATPSPRAAGVSRHHESARAQVAGGATYIDDIPEVRGTLHAAPICSPVAHGRLRGIDATAALALPGVRGIVDARDIPGDPVLAAFSHDGCRPPVRSCAGRPRWAPCPSPNAPTRGHRPARAGA